MAKSERIERIKYLVTALNEAARAYYAEDKEIMSNWEYDALYDELQSLEQETGMVLANSPTVNVGYEAVDELPKERHESPMLSLDKTKSREALRDWLQGHPAVLSWKLDGLTIVLTYRGGKLEKAVTRGNGEIGEVITNNARTFVNLPYEIPFKGELILRGEAVISYSDFEKINAGIEDVESKYKNPRNLCSGSVRQLNNEVTAQRNVRFFAFTLVSARAETADSRVAEPGVEAADSRVAEPGTEAIGSRVAEPGAEAAGFGEPGAGAQSVSFGEPETGADSPDFSDSVEEQFRFLEEQGFEVVEHYLVTEENILDTIELFEKKIENYDIPSDGLVLTYDDIAYGQSLGRTAKFPRHSIAFKWADELRETTLKEIEWSASRTGLINPVAIFEPVELEGTTVSRASVHNISILRALQLGIGDRITVYKANMIIPQIAENLTAKEELEKMCAEAEDSTETADGNGIVPSEEANAEEEDSGDDGKSALEDADVETDDSEEGRKSAPEDDGAETGDSEEEGNFGKSALKRPEWKLVVIPKKCPVCGGKTEIRQVNDVQSLYCTNDKCAAKQIKAFTLFVSRDAMNIDGLSEATLEKFIDLGFIHEFADLFHLDRYREQIVEMEGFGEKSYRNLMDSIEKARHTTLPRLIYGLGIANIGVANAKMLCRFFDHDLKRMQEADVETLSAIDGVGEVIATAFVSYMQDADNLRRIADLTGELEIEIPRVEEGSQTLSGLNFVITGSLNKFASRNDLKEAIEKKGGKVTGSVTSKTTCLINNDVTSTSSKNKKARDLGIPVLSEADFLARYEIDSAEEG